MSIVPFKSKLSYAWARIARENRIYSHVLEQRGTAGVTGLPDERINTKTYLWIKATQIQGSPETFKADLCSYYTFAKPNWKSVRDQRSYEELPFNGAFTKEEINKLVKAWEAEGLKNRDMTPTTKQPFKAFIKTKLTN